MRVFRFRAVLKQLATDVPEFALVEAIGHAGCI
jgi:hypothetical protein